jgi:hypothetical protein
MSSLLEFLKRLNIFDAVLLLLYMMTSTESCCAGFQGRVSAPPPRRAPNPKVQLLPSLLVNECVELGENIVVIELSRAIT